MHRLPSRRVITAVAAVAALLALNLAAVPAGAAFPGRNGAIAFARNQSIVSKAPFGSTMTTLATGLVTAPSYSRNGAKIVYLRGSMEFGPGWYDIMTMNADGTGKRNVTRSVDRYSAPSFRPDGNKIIFTLYDGNPSGNLRLYTINVDGTGRTHFAPGVGGSMQDGVYAPGGGRVAYTGAATGAAPVLRTIASTGDKTTVATVSSTLTNASQPDWSPSGTRLVFTRSFPNNNEKNVLAINANGTGARNLADYGGDRYAMDAVYSPDGAKIAFTKTVTNPATDPEIWIMNADGTNKTLSSSNGYVYEPTWRPLP